MAEANRPLRVGVVGCGSFGRRIYCRHVTDHPDAELAAVCDVERERAADTAREFATEGGPAVYVDYAEMIQREALDVVMVGTLADMRPRVAVAALESGCHVLAAKPMVPSLEQAEHMLRTATETQRLLMVGYNFRFRDDAQALRRFVDSGGLGEPLFARTWIYTEGVPTNGPHYIKSQSSGGSLANTGIHLQDLGVWYLDSPSLVAVEAQSRSRLAALGTLPPELEEVRPVYDIEDLLSAYCRFVDFHGGLKESDANRV